MDRKRLAREELIGQHVTIQDCTDPGWINKSGIVIDETKNTFLIEIGNKRKRIAKKTATFRFQLDEKSISLEGSKLMFRPEDRIKKIR
jgi:ribonuclease P protein subunit POP4